MKRIIVISLAFMFFTQGFAQNKAQKQTVYSFVKVRHTLEWYEEQRQLWEEEIKTNPKNAEAWLNVYTAMRMIRLSKGQMTNEEISKFLERAGKNIPETFEYNYIMYWNQGIAGKADSYLEKAKKLGPDRPELIDDFITLYEVKRDKIHLKEYCNKAYETNEISPGLLSFNYNMLVSCDQNAILLTVGDNDTYPSWVLQYSRNIRNDVSVLNASLIMGIESYRNAYFKELGIPELKQDELKGNYVSNVQYICRHIQKFSTRPFYYSVTVQSEIFDNVKDSIYSVGVAWKYAKNKFDNIATLRKNFEQKYLTDYIQFPMQNDISQSVVNDINYMYLASFITLHKHYSCSGEITKKEALKELILSIASKSDIMDDIEKLLNE